MSQFISTDLTFKEVHRNFSALCDEKAIALEIILRLTGLKYMDISLIALFIAICVHYCKLIFCTLPQHF